MITDKERHEYFACGGEFAVLALPLIAGVLIYGFEGISDEEG